MKPKKIPFSVSIIDKIRAYHPKGGLDTTAIFSLDLMKPNHAKVRIHTENVALMAESIALMLKKDAKAAFFAGLMHDTGKITLPGYLFDGRDITADEYAEVKKHAISGFISLKEVHLFIAYCAGLHHALYEKGYGLTIHDFPKKWQPRTVKKALEIAAIIAVCDDIEAFLTRKTKMKGDAGKPGMSLKERLEIKFPDDLQVVDLVLKIAEGIINRKKR